MFLVSGINNAILILLLILIIHIIVKNMIKKETFISPVKPNQIVSSSNATLSTKVATPDKCNTNDESKNELMDFVFGNKNETCNDLDMYFKDVTKKIENCEETKFTPTCPILKDDHTKPLPSTCDPMLKEDKPDVKETKPICNDKRDLSIIKEYKEESMMCGGPLYDNITAFDDFNLEFQEIGFTCDKTLDEQGP